MPIATFLAADMPLTKSFAMKDGAMVKIPYPHAFHFTSHASQFSDLRSLLPLLRSHSEAGHCLLKGNVAKPLVKESRAGSTDRSAPTELAVLDYDAAEFATPEDALRAVHLDDVSYIVQYSSSHGIVEGAKLSCHIYMMLSSAIGAPLLNCWLMNLNFQYLRGQITLSPAGAALHWPLDVTACQNDKLIYLADPVLGKGIKCSFREPRIQLVEKKIHVLNTRRIELKTKDELNKTKRDVINELRKAAGMAVITHKVRTMKQGGEFQPGVGESVITGFKEDRGFRYFNLNGGDSWGYFHPVDNFEFIHNFKGEPSYLTKELLPGYHEDCIKDQKAAAVKPDAQGIVPLCFRDEESSAYFNGTWNEQTKKLALFTAKGREQLEDYMAAYGRVLADNIPVWNMIFDPQSDTVVDFENQRINSYQMSEHMKGPHKKRAKPPARIHSVFESAVGTGAILEHMYNWLAVLLQHRIKIGTAWMLMGAPGTGKGLIHKIMREAIGPQYVVQKRASELQSQYNSWMKEALLVVVDEAKISRLKNSDTVSADLKNFITEDKVSLNGKYLNAVTVLSYMNFMLCSNENEPERIPEGDRRYNVSDFRTVPYPKLSDPDYDLLMAEVPQFVEYLMTREADVKRARTVLHTESRDALIDASMTSMQTVSKAILEGDLEQLWDAISDVHDAMSVSASFAASFKALMESIVLAPEENDRLTRDQLVMIYRHCIGRDVADTPHKFTATIKHHRLILKRTRFDSGLKQGINVTWKFDPTWLEERRAEITARKTPTKKSNVVPIAKAKVVTK